MDEQLENDRRENEEIRKRVIQNQKVLQDKKEKQKRIVFNEMKRKFAETQSERWARIRRDRES